MGGGGKKVIQWAAAKPTSTYGWQHQCVDPFVLFRIGSETAPVAFNRLPLLLREYLFWEIDQSMTLPILSPCSFSAGPAVALGGQEGAVCFVALMDTSQHHGIASKAADQAKEKWLRKPFLLSTERKWLNSLNVGKKKYRKVKVKAVFLPSLAYRSTEPVAPILQNEMGLRNHLFVWS